MNRDAKFLTKYWQIQPSNTKRIIDYEQMKLFPGVQGWFNIKNNSV